MCGKAKGTTGGEKLSQVIEVDERKMRAHLREVVRRTVEQRLNALLDAEDRGAKAERYERTAACNTRTSCYRRGLQTGAGEVTMKMPKLRTLTFETAVIQGYERRREFGRRSDGDMYLARRSVLRLKDITSREMRTGEVIDQVNLSATEILARVKNSMNSRERMRGVSQSKDVRTQDTDKRRRPDACAICARQQKGTQNFSQ